MPRKKIYRVYILAFIFTLHIALSAYANSTFLSQIIGEKYVGVLYTIASIITLMLLSNTSLILKYFGNRKLILIFIMINMMSLATLIVSSNPVYISMAFIAFMVTNTLVLFCVDIFIEHFGTPNTIGRTRGIYLTITNLGWICSPLISSFLITKEGGYRAIYILAFIMTIVMSLGMFVYVKKFKDKVYQKTPFLKVYKFLKTNRHIRAIAFINFILQFFFAIMVVYIPLYLHAHIGLAWNKLGIIFTIMLIPFILLGIPTGILIDKYHVRKRLLITIGLLIMIVSTILISQFTTSSIVFWAIILFMTRVGAALVETTSEIYFFTHVREEDAYLLSIFRDMTPIAYIIAPILASLFLLIFPFKYLFLGLGIFVIIGLYYVTQLKHRHHAIGIPDQNK
ncbi:MFS transporter [Candidatus Nomurabacteria bacterium]|nr:MFS transporter [Candidatus Nomurabacteria bacterium]